MKTLICVVIYAVLALPAVAQQGNFVAPANADLNRFPIKQHSLSLSEQVELGLSAKRLETPAMVQNHFRNVRSGRFVLETLAAGTLVLVDRDGKLRYKADCGNRLVEIVQCPSPTIVGGTDSGHATGNKKSLASSPSAWSRFWDSMGKAWDSTWGGIGSLLGFLIPLLLLLLLLALLALLAYIIAETIRNPRRNQQGPIPPLNQPHPVIAPPVQPAPVVQIPAPAPAVAPPVVPPRPVPVPPAPPVFPANRAVIDFGRDGNATRIQSGQNIDRVEFDRDQNNGSTTVRIFHA